jgi:hypothetical protein
LFAAEDISIILRFSYHGVYAKSQGFFFIISVSFPTVRNLFEVSFISIFFESTFSIDGKYVYPSSGEVIDVKTRKILTTLKDEFPLC